MARSSRKSRRTTPWDSAEKLTPTQAFLKRHYEAHYKERHPLLKETGEAELINSYRPAKCPYCGSERFQKYGFNPNGVQKYRCTCGKMFIPTTGTIFDEHKISLSEWMEYCLNIFRYVSINADSWNNKNAYTTSQYWFRKLLLTLEGYQENIVLSGRVFLDETFYSLRKGDLIHNADGSELRGLSRNQICIGVATDERQCVLVIEGTGKPTQDETFQAFSKHIAKGSVLVHDKEDAHNKLVRELNLQSEAYLSADLKQLDDKSNPLAPVNQIHDLFKRFLYAHNSFNRDFIQGYADLFAFVINPPHDQLEKVERIVKMAFESPKVLRYRDMFSKKTDS